MFKKSFMIGLALVLTMVSLFAEEVELDIVRSVRVSFPTETGKQYQILTSTDIDSGMWVALGDPISSLTERGNHLLEGTGEVYTFYRDSENPAETILKVEEIGTINPRPSEWLLFPAVRSRWVIRRVRVIAMRDRCIRWM